MKIFTSLHPIGMNNQGLLVSQYPRIVVEKIYASLGRNKVLMDSRVCAVHPINTFVQQRLICQPRQ